MSRWLLIPAVLLVLAAPAARGQPLPATRTAATTVLARVQAYYDRTADYKASFKQVVTTQAPHRVFARSGNVYFKRPGMMRWDYKDPDQVYYVSDGKDLWSYEVEEGIAYRLRVDRSDLFQALRFLTGPTDLASEFQVEEGAPAPTGLVPLKLTPRGSQSAFRSVTLFADPATGEVRESEVVDPIGNVSHLTFSGPSTARLPSDRFKFTPPAGVRVQDLTK